MIFYSSISDDALNQVIFKSKTGGRLISLLSHTTENINSGRIFSGKNPWFTRVGCIFGLYPWHSSTVFTQGATQR